MRKRLLIVVSIAGLLGLQFADCMSARTSREALQLTATIPCLKDCVFTRKL